ncbi:hypothetical protein Tsp_13039, partial [Trichinella spiralis]
MPELNKKNKSVNTIEYLIVTCTANSKQLVKPKIRSYV